MKQTIIWIDDDAQYMEDARLAFEENGYSIIACTTLMDGLHQLLTGVTMNLLVDIDFPGNSKEGLLFLQQVTKLQPLAKVILFTGYPELNDAVQSVRDLLAADYIGKGIVQQTGGVEMLFKKLREGFGKPSRFITDTNHLDLIKIRTALEENDLPRFVELLQAAFAGLSYNIKIQESYFHILIHFLLKFAGMEIESEVETNNGRIDAVAKTGRYIYLFEFKLNDAAKALKQIKDRKYYQRYLSDPREKIMVGLSFDRRTRNLRDDIQVESYFRIAK